MRDIRRDQLTAQKVNIGRIFREMLGSADARAYLVGENVPEEVIERVMAGQTTRPDEPAAAPPPALAPVPAVPDAPLVDLHGAFYCNSGRRRDAVKAAVVQASLAIDRELGRDRAEALLRREALPEDVITRVLAGDGANRRAR